MRGANILTGCAVSAWIALLLIGASLIQGVTSQNAPGYPNSGQIELYLVYPALVVAVLVACAWLFNGVWRRASPLALLSGAALLAALPYVMFFGGGV
jgi:hypothetical protein